MVTSQRTGRWHTILDGLSPIRAKGCTLVGELIDTTEMYLKTIYELVEDGVPPLRARIVDRLGHSGPTVSQTVARMERDGLVQVLEDRRLELTKRGYAIATDVVRKHRLAERLLLDIVGLEWEYVHDEACRWEHVMSRRVEDRLQEILQHPEVDPYGNPLPGNFLRYPDEQPLSRLAAEGDGPALVTRLGEPAQAEPDLLADLKFADVQPGTSVQVREVMGLVEISTDTGTVRMDAAVARHVFVLAE